MKSLFRSLTIVALALATHGCANQATEPTTDEGNTAEQGSPISGAEQGVAIQGYDTVAYWKTGKAVRGSPEHSAEWAGTVWFFTSRENRNLFRETPERYAPEYGGFCALAVAYGETAPGAGNAWEIRDEELYLFGSKESREKWLEGDTDWYIQEADHYWPSVKRRVQSGR